MSRIKSIIEFGQQIWLDNLSRHLLESGELLRRITQDGIAGVTSNPAIFYNAISKDSRYQQELEVLKKTEPDLEYRFEALVLPDVIKACKLLYPLYKQTQGEKGYVSFEVSPYLAQDADATVAAAKRLWNAIQQPNLMIKIPATQEGIEAFEEVIAEGINVNITLMFSEKHVTDVFTSYQQGIQRRINAGLSVDTVRAVASVFISRLDTQLDPLLPDVLTHLKGKIAIASAKQAYSIWQKTFSSPSFNQLKTAGAFPQLLLWASTGTKNPAYRDVYYLEELIGPHTINTAPEATLDAFADHGNSRRSLDENLAQAEHQLAELQAHGFDLQKLGELLQAEGLKQFEEAYKKLMVLVS